MISYTGRVATYCLSFHASYRCRHVGACCNADWDVEVEDRIVDALTGGRLRPVYAAVQPFRRARDENGREFSTPARTATGTCAFRHAERCSLQVSGGEAMLPAACRHFPRIYLRGPRGDRLTLSHYCPTAAALLFDAGEISIVETAPPLALEGSIEGLDARQSLPPLLRPAMLMDHDAYDAWERLLVSVLAAAPTVADAMATAAAATERLRRWRPADGALTTAVRNSLAGPAPAAGRDRLSKGFEVLADVTGEHPLLAMPSDFPAAWHRLYDLHRDRLDEPVRRYLAACVFGNWVAYRSQGLRSILEWLRACFDVLRLQITRAAFEAGALTRDSITSAIRASDYMIVHTVDTQAFGRAIAIVE